MASAQTCAALLLGLSAAILSLVRPHGCEVVLPEAVEIQAEVGGSVQMDCNLQGYFYLYWQKNIKSKDRFVNGLSKGKELDVEEEYINRSRVYETNGSLELWNLKVSDTGYYTCVKVLDNAHKTHKRPSYYHLFVTARYTKPVLTTHFPANGLLEVTCSTWGGYPPYDIQWRGEPNSTVLWEKQPGNRVQDETDQLWNLTSTVELNCTQPLRISCAVGNTTSEELKICAVPPPFSLEVIIAIVVVSAVAFGMLLAFLLKLRNRSSDGERAGAEQMPLRTTPDSSSSEVETSAGHVTTPQQDPV